MGDIKPRSDRTRKIQQLRREISALKSRKENLIPPDPKDPHDIIRERHEAHSMVLIPLEQARRKLENLENHDGILGDELGKQV